MSCLEYMDFCKLLEFDGFVKIDTWKVVTWIHLVKRHIIPSPAFSSWIIFSCIFSDLYILFDEKCPLIISFSSSFPLLSSNFNSHKMLFFVNPNIVEPHLKHTLTPSQVITFYTMFASLSCRLLKCVRRVKFCLV